MRVEVNAAAEEAARIAAEAEAKRVAAQQAHDAVVAKAVQERNSLGEKVRVRQGEIDRLEQALMEAFNAVEAAEGEVKKAAAEEKATAEKKLADAKAELVKAQKARTGNKEQIEALTKEQGVVENSVKKAVEALEVSGQLAKQANKKVAELNQAAAEEEQKTAAEAKLAKEDKRIAAEKAKFEEARKAAEISGLPNRVKSLEDKDTEQSGQLKELVDGLAGVKSDGTSTSEEVDALTKRVGAMENSDKLICDAINRLRANQEAQKKSLDTIVTELINSEKETKAAILKLQNTTNTALKHLYCELSAELARLEAQIDILSVKPKSWSEWLRAGLWY